MVFFLGDGGGIRGRTVRCGKRRPCSTPGNHGSQGPELCTPDAVLNGSCTLLWGCGFQGVFPG